MLGAYYQPSAITDDEGMDTKANNTVSSRFEERVAEERLAWNF